MVMAQPGARGGEGGHHKHQQVVRAACHHGELTRVLLGSVFKVSTKAGVTLTSSKLQDSENFLSPDTPTACITSMKNVNVYLHFSLGVVGGGGGVGLCKEQLLC